MSVLDFAENSSQTKVSYSENLNSSYFESGDSFGLFIFADNGSIAGKNVKINCTGNDGQGNNSWAKDLSSYPDKTLSDVLDLGTKYLAYYPYDAAFDAVADTSGIRTKVNTIKATTPSDQSSCYKNSDFLIVSNLGGYSFGTVTRAGSKISMNFTHAKSMLRLILPAGSLKYEYRYKGSDFTPYLAKSSTTEDVYQYIISPGDNIDISIRYIHDKKLYEFAYHYNMPWRVTSVANTCYSFVNGEYMPSHQELIDALGYPLMVDLGLPSHTLWATIDLRTDESLYKAHKNYEKEEIQKVAGDLFAWGETSPREDFSTARTGPDLDYRMNIIGTQYDAARALWGNNWQLPSVIDINELYLYCTFEKTAEDANVYKITGPSGKYIYMYGYGYKKTDNSIKGQGEIFSHIGEALYVMNNSSSSGEKPSTVFVNHAKTTADNRSFLSNVNNNHKFRPDVIDPSYGMVIRPVYKVKVDIRDSGGVREDIAVDMGLPSGTKWAPFNLGVDNLVFNACSVEVAADMEWLSKLQGEYYAYGETSTKPFFSSEKWTYSGSKASGTDISGTVYDAAKANWGNGWVMPTTADYLELFTNSNVYKTKLTFQGNEYPHYYLVSKKNGNILRFPVTGQLARDNSDNKNYKWDSYGTMNTMAWMSLMKDSKKAVWLNVDNGSNTRYEDKPNWVLDGWKGLNIRPVLRKTTNGTIDENINDGNTSDWL